MSAAEELFHIFRITAGGMIPDRVVVDFDSANWTDGAFVAEDEIDGFVFNETVSFGTALAADFMAKKGAQGDIGDNIEAFAEDFAEDLETMFLGIG